MKVSATYDDTLYQLVPKRLPFDTEMRPVIARMCRAVEGGACIMFDDFWSDLLSAAPTPPAQPAERMPLTRYAINELMKDCGWQNSAIRQADLDGCERLVRAIEAAHGITAPKEPS